MAFLGRPEAISTVTSKPSTAASGAACSLAKGVAPSSSAAAQRLYREGLIDCRTDSSTARASRRPGRSSVEYGTNSALVVKATECQRRQDRNPHHGTVCDQDEGFCRPQPRCPRSEGRRSALRSPHQLPVPRLLPQPGVTPHKPAPRRAAIHRAPEHRIVV